MKLTVKDRLMLLNVLPNEGTLVTLKLVRELREDLSFTEEESAALNFEQEGEQLRWNQEADVIKDIHIGEVMSDMVKVAFKKLDTDEKLTIDLLEVYEKFIK